LEQIPTRNSIGYGQTAAQRITAVGVSIVVIVITMIPVKSATTICRLGAPLIKPDSSTTTTHPISGLMDLGAIHQDGFNTAGLVITMTRVRLVTTICRPAVRRVKLVQSIITTHPISGLMDLGAIHQAGINLTTTVTSIR